MKRLLVALLALLLTLAAAGALAQDAAADATPEPMPDATPEPTREPDYDRLVVGGTTAMSGNFFSEMFGNNTADEDVQRLLHGYNLMEWKSETGAYGINPSVVSGVVADDDARGNRVYTVSLYTDLTYSDGTRITAADYAFSMLLSVHPAMKAIGAQTVGSDYIVGVEEYKAGTSDTLSGMRILNDTMFTVTIKAEYEPFFYELALLDYDPYPIHVIAPGCEVVDNGSGIQIRNTNGGRSKFTEDLLRKTILDPKKGYLSHPSVVSGPYVLDSYDAGAHTATFSINPYYKGNSDGKKPSIKTLVYRQVTPDTMIQELEDGDVGLLNKAASAEVITQGLDLTSRERFLSANYPRTGYSFVGFSCEMPAVSSVAVRQAIAHCLDKQTLVEEYVSNYGLAVDGYYGLGQWMYQQVSGQAQLLAPADGATEEEVRAYQEAVTQWEALSLDGVKVYELDVNEAIRLLESDGWTLNAQGGSYSAQNGDVRCKEIDGELVALDLKLIYPEGNAIADWFDATLISNLAQAGIRVTAEAREMSELLRTYYRETPRDAELIYLATNFATVFDPAGTYSPEDAYQGKSNRSGLADDELYRLAVDMRKTEPGDTLGYCQKWVAFQERWAQVLPAIPVYSNVYFDFYEDILQDYEINTDVTWADAIVGAYLGEPPALPQDDADDAGDGDLLILD